MKWQSCKNIPQEHGATQAWDSNLFSKHLHKSHHYLKYSGERFLLRNNLEKNSPKNTIKTLFLIGNFEGRLSMNLWEENWGSH